MRNTQEPPGADSGGPSALAGEAPAEGGQKIAEVVNRTAEGAVYAVRDVLPAGAFMTSDHRYYFNGEPSGGAPSVTTILEVMSKPALVTWKAQEAARALWRRFYDPSGTPVALTEDEAVKWAIQQTDSQRDKAAGIGTGVHLLADLVARSGESPQGQEKAVDGFSISEQEKPYVDAFRGFLAFLEAQGGRIVSSEHAVWSLNGYAGTYDLIVEFNWPGPFPDKGAVGAEFPQLWLIDIKTSKGYYPEYGLQLAGYRWSDYIILSGDPRPYPMPEIHRTGVLHLRPEQYSEGWRLVEYPTTYEKDYLTFLGALEIHKWRKEGRFQKQNLNTVLST